MIWQLFWLFLFLDQILDNFSDKVETCTFIFHVFPVQSIVIDLLTSNDVLVIVFHLFLEGDGELFVVVEQGILICDASQTRVQLLEVVGQKQVGERVGDGGEIGFVVVVKDQFRVAKAQKVKIGVE